MTDIDELIERGKGAVTDAALRLIAGAFRIDGQRLEEPRRPRFTIPRQADDSDSLVIDWIDEATAALAELRERLEKAERENTRPSPVLTNSDQPCAYCGLSKEDSAKCELGFPGCSRGDKTMQIVEQRLDGHIKKPDPATPAK